MKTTDVPVEQLGMVIATYLFVPPDVVVAWVEDDGLYTVSKADDDIPEPLPDADDASEDATDLDRPEVGPEMQVRAEDGAGYLLAVRQDDGLYTVRTAETGD